MVDTVGNRLGPRAFFEYTTDNGQTFKMLLDESVATAVGNDAAAASLSRIYASGTIPVTPRYILLQLGSDPTITKQAIIGDPSNALFDTLGSSPVTINGVVWNTTGRVGEKASWGF